MSNFILHGFFLLIILIGCLASTSIRAQEVDVQVRGAIDIESVNQLKGDAEYTIFNSGDTAISSLRFLLYPNQFTQLSENLPVYTRNWIYPSGFREGKMVILDVTDTASGKSLTPQMSSFQIGKSTVADFILKIDLPAPLPAGDRITVRIRYTMKVPKRRGRFGYYDGVVSLAGGWLPRPIPERNGLSRIPYPLSLNLTATLPGGFGGFVVNQIVANASDSQSVAVSMSHVTEPTIVLMDKMELRNVHREEGTIHYLTNHYVESAKKMPMDPRVEMRPKKERAMTSRAKHIRRTVKIVDEVRSLFLPYHPPKKDLYIIEIPAWDRLSQLSGDILLLSDRTFEVVPYPKALMFHQSDVAKTVATLLALDFTGKDNALSPFTAEVIGYHFQKRYLKVAEEKREELAQLLRFLAFNPYVDNLIYAPQMPFEHAYVRTVEENDLFRGELWRILNNLPRGKRIAAKIEDVLGEDDTETFFNEYLGNHLDFTTFIQQRLPMGQKFIDQWFGAYPTVGYALGDTSSHNGSTGYDHRVSIIQNGEAIVEPVTVLVVDRDNQQKRLRWDGIGTRTTLQWHSDAPLKSVQIDPDFRLVETAKVQGHPMSDNARPLGMRPPLLTDLNAWWDSVTRKPFFFIAFSLRRKYDISNSFHLSSSYTPRQKGGALSYFRHFGYNSTLNARTWYVGPRLGVFEYLDATTTEPGIHKNNRYIATLVSISILAGMDNRRFLLDPQSGKSFQISLGYWAGKSRDNGVVQHAKGSLRVFKVFPLALGHTFVAFSGISAVIGEPPASNLVTLSHQMILRGFDLGETYGRVGVYGVAEYRHTLIGATSLQFPLRTLLSRVQGVLFAGAGSASRPETYRTLFQPERNFAEVGYGLRFHFLLMGAVPYLLALDFVVPVHPVDRRYTVKNKTGSDVSSPREPWRIVLGFSQTF